MTYYYLEYRQPQGFDGSLADFGNLTAGHPRAYRCRQAMVSPATMLDMTPDSVPASPVSDMEDGALTVGRTFVDSVAGDQACNWSPPSADGRHHRRQPGSGVRRRRRCAREPRRRWASAARQRRLAARQHRDLHREPDQPRHQRLPDDDLQPRTHPPQWLGWRAGHHQPGACARVPAGSTTLTVTSPAMGSGGWLHASATGASSSQAGSVHTATGATAPYNVAAAAPVGTLTETVGTDSTGYLRGETVHMSARVLAPRRTSGGRCERGERGRDATRWCRHDAERVTASDGYARCDLQAGQGQGCGRAATRCVPMRPAAPAVPAPAAGFSVL